MAEELGIGLGALGLLVGFPLLLLGGIGVLGWLEAWMLQPYERAVQINELLDRVEEAEELERAVTQLVAHVADAPAQHPRRAGLLQAASQRVKARAAARQLNEGATASSRPSSRALR